MTGLAIVLILLVLAGGWVLILHELEQINAFLEELKVEEFKLEDLKEAQDVSEDDEDQKV